jgi:uncharacterized membrane protein
METAHGIPLLTLGLILIASLLVVGRDQGWRCLVLLAGFPALLFAAGWLMVAAHAPALPTLLTAGAIALAGQVFLLLGPGIWGRLAFLGAAGGYLVALLIAGVCVRTLHVTGVHTGLLRDLWYAPGTAHLNFSHLAIGAIALAGAGIIADLAVAVTATIQEVHKANPHLTPAQRFAAGMRFGRDVIGTEINTLPFAILGIGMGGILLVLVKPDVQRWPYTWMELANRQSIAVEVTAMAAGTIGLALTIPLTAFLSSRYSVAPANGSKPTATEASQLKTHHPLAAALLLAIAAWLTVFVFHRLGTTSYHYPANGRPTQTRLLRGEVLGVQTPESSDAPLTQRRRREAVQALTVRTTAAAAPLTVENAITGSPVNDRVVTPGDRIIVRVQESTGERYASVAEIERDRPLILLLLVVCAVVARVSGWHGWRALAALAASIGIIGIFLAAMIRTPLPTLPLALGCALSVASVTYVLLCGFRRKALEASLGVVLGLAVAATAGILFGRWLGLSGRHDGDLMALAFYSTSHAFNFPALLGASVLIGALGVTMDVAIAVASAVEEVHRANPQSEFKVLLAAGLSVGRKVIVAMVGAIFFASVGLNLALFLIPWTTHDSLRQAFCSEHVAAETYRLLIAGLAIAWSVPATALCSAWFTSRQSRTRATQERLL